MTRIPAGFEPPFASFLNVSYQYFCTVGHFVDDPWSREADYPLDWPAPLRLRYSVWYNVCVHTREVPESRLRGRGDGPCATQIPRQEGTLPCRVILQHQPRRRVVWKNHE